MTATTDQMPATTDQSPTTTDIMPATTEREPLTYRVYLGRYLGNEKTDHHAIYVEIDQVAQTGMLHHVVDSILMGMEYQSRQGVDPLLSPTGLSRQHVGWITEENYLFMEPVLQKITPPIAQLALNGSKLDPSRPIRHCQHWAAEGLDALKVEGFLDPLGPTDDPRIELRV